MRDILIGLAIAAVGFGIGWSIAAATGDRTLRRVAREWREARDKAVHERNVARNWAHRFCVHMACLQEKLEAKRALSADDNAMESIEDLASK